MEQLHYEEIFLSLIWRHAGWGGYNWELWYHEGDGGGESRTITHHTLQYYKLKHSNYPQDGFKTDKSNNFPLQIQQEVKSWSCGTEVTDNIKRAGCTKWMNLWTAILKQMRERAKVNLLMILIWMLGKNMKWSVTCPRLLLLCKAEMLNRWVIGLTQ